MSQSHKVSLILQDLASNISDILQDTAGEPLAFVLVVSADNTAQYVSNAGRADGTELIESLLERWKAGRADIPAHYNPDLKSPAPVAVQPSQWQDIAGWKLVPIEPTEAMVEYGKDERMRCFDTTGRESNPVSVGEALTRIYGAMLSASPEDTK